jgi:hypothetical protein
MVLNISSYEHLLFSIFLKLRPPALLKVLFFILFQNTETPKNNYKLYFNKNLKKYLSIIKNGMFIRKAIKTSLKNIEAKKN